MLIHKKGDILSASENVICHQVNAEGIMGGGLAKQIADKYPHVKLKYKLYCNAYKNNYKLLSNKFCTVKIDSNQFIVNCFTQKPNFETDYKALKICFEKLLKLVKKDKSSICIPYKYGCGIAKGDWNIVENIFSKLSDKYNIDIVVYEL